MNADAACRVGVGGRLAAARTSRSAATICGIAAACAALAMLRVACAGQTLRTPAMTRIADGVFLFTTPPYGDVGLDGNSIAIVGRESVLVFDSNGTPAASAAVLAGIRTLTPQPVRYVVNSHWHWDHWYGTETYLRAFPDLRVIAHERTRAMMIGPALAFNRPGIEQELPAYLETLRRKLESAAAANPSARDVAALRDLLADDTLFVNEKSRVHLVFPNVTYTGAFNIDLGGRRVEVRHHDRAVTPGDTYLYLPDDKVLVTGDLLVNPISFALSAYPTGWLRTLEHLETLDAATIVPGHGAPMHTKDLLRAHIALFRELLRRGAAAKASGLGVDEAKTAMMPALHDLEIPFTHDDPQLHRQFEVYLVDWYLHRVYDELNGPLTDDIAPVPKQN